MEKIDRYMYLRQATENFRQYVDDDIENLEETVRTPVELYRRKINDNLKLLNMKTTNVIQDGLDGVENICNQVRECLRDEQRCMVCSEKYMDKCGSGDIMDYVEENTFTTSAKYRTHDALSLISSDNPTLEDSKKTSTNHNTSAVPHNEEDREETSSKDNTTSTVRHMKENSKETSTNNNTSIVGHIAEDIEEKIPEAKKREKSGSGPNFTGSTVNKNIATCKQHEVVSNSHNPYPETSEIGRKCVKRKCPSRKTKKKRSDTESEAPAITDNDKTETRMEKKTVNSSISAKERLGEMEKDYEKVVKSLQMVEQMMASISKKVSDSEKLPQENAKTEEKIITLQSFNAEENLLKQENTDLSRTLESPTKTKTEDKSDRKKKIVDKNWVNEMIKRKKSRETEKRVCEEVIMIQMEENVQKAEPLNTDPELKPRTSQESVRLSKSQQSLSDIKLRESLSDLDALIDNAVQELGNLVSDFDISRNSSDVSFRLTTVDDTKNLYEDYLRTTSSSNFSESPLGEDSAKFEISKSFQELKESFLKENRCNTEVSDRKKRGKEQVKECKDHELDNTEQRSSIENQRPKNNEQIKFIQSATSQCSSKKNISNISKNAPLDEEDQTNVFGKEVNDKDIEASINSLTQLSKEEDKEDDILISMLCDKRFRSSSKSKKPLTTNQHINTKEIDEGPVQNTITLKECSQESKTSDDFEQNQNDTKKEIEDDNFSESEFCECVEHFELNSEEETNLNNEQNKKEYTEVNDKITRINQQDQTQESVDRDGESSVLSSDNLPENKTTARNKLARCEQEPKIHSRTDNVLTSSGNSSSSQSWNEDNQPTIETHAKPIDPMKQISVQCNKMIGDLVVEEEAICLPKLMKGFFNCTLIQTTVGRFKRGRSARLLGAVQDPDLKNIEPNVHRKRAISDLHDRMEHQIRQTDSFHGFLNLMDKKRRRAFIKHAEKQEHNYRCQMKPCLRKRYPFKVVTASVPPNYDVKTKDRKDPEKRYINSLWFSPKDFKLRRNSRIFNKKRLEMYCQSLHRGPMISKCKCKEAVSKESKQSTKTSNYKILVRSGTPLGRRPNTPTRWAQTHSTINAEIPQRTRLRHCDIFDDLSLKDLAPFKSEYPRRDEITKPKRMKDTFFYKLTNDENMEEAENTLMELITPGLSCTETGCKVCIPKAKSEKKYSKRQKTLKKSSNETASKKDDLQTLSPKAAAQLLIQNIGEIKSRKSSPKTQSSEKCLTKQKDIKTKKSMRSIGKRNSKRALAQDSKSVIYQKIEENLIKNIFCDQRIPVIKLGQKSASSSPASSVKPINSFKRVETFQNVIKIPEIRSKPTRRNSAMNKLFPYINDPENRVFQNITVLPVKVLYEKETLNDTTKNKNEQPCGDNLPDDYSTCLSTTRDAEVGTVDQQKYSAENDCKSIKILDNIRQKGTLRSIQGISCEDPKKTLSSHAKSVGVSSLENERSRCVEVPCSPDGKEAISFNHQGTKMSSTKSKFGRSNSLGKSTESENSDFRSFDQHPQRRSFNPNPWKPSCRIPEPLPLTKSPMRIKSKDHKHNQTQPPKTLSTGKIIVKEENSCGHLPLVHKMREKGANCSKRSLTSHLSRESSHSQILVNKDKKIKFGMKPTKQFYEIDEKGNKCQNIRASRNNPSSPSHKAMVDHLCALRNRNVRLQGSIQKAINIIEEKMVDVLSTKDHNSKKKTIERMEKEINNVLRMINEQSYKMKHTDNVNERRRDDISEHQSDNVKVQTELSERVDNISYFTQAVVPNTAIYSVMVQNEERPTLDTKALVMHIPPAKTTRTPRKRATSRLLKLQARPSTVEEESRSTPSEEEFHEIGITERCVKIENEGTPEKLQDAVPELKEMKEETKICTRPLEIYPFVTADGQASLSPLLPCPTPIPSLTCQNLSRKAQKAIKKMSLKAFGKFADVVKTKTSLIINMTERIDIDDPDKLPNPRIISTLPVQPKRPVITKMGEVLVGASDNMIVTRVPSFVSVHQEPATYIMNNSADIPSALVPEILDASTNNISEFGNIIYDRSLTSFSESECFYSWPQFQRTSAIQSKDSTCTITHEIINKDCLTPFMRALGNLRKSRLFENRHQLIPLEETSPSFTRLMDLLEGLSNINNRLNQKALKDVQLMWNPERRCSFHSSMKCFKKISYAIDTKAVSAHSIIHSATSSCSETTLGEKPEDNLSKNNNSANDDEEKCEELSNTKEDIKEKYESEITKEIREIYKSPKQDAKEIECNMSEVELKQKSVDLVLSEIHLISIPNARSYKKELKIENIEFNNQQMKTDFTMIKNEYETFLKIFYLLFYGLIYLCMNSMNFTC